VGGEVGLGHRLRDGGFPDPTETVEVGTLIVGGGVAGLAAARELDRGGMKDWRLLELAGEPGGNSAWGRNGTTEFPWGAHYVPLPGVEAPEVLALFEELGVIRRRDAQGRPVYAEEFLCHDPEERLFHHGRWQEGLVPHLGVSPADRVQIAGFLERMNQFRQATGGDGRPVFAVPADRSSRDPEWLKLDQIPFAAWLDREGYTAAPLRWYLDYGCRDDFGSGVAVVSAWAGLHYFASRRGVAANAPSHAVVTWPAGNGWLIQRLRAGLDGRIDSGSAAFRVQPETRGVEVWAWSQARERTVRYRAQAVVLAVPQFIGARLMAGHDAVPGRGGGVYPPWMVANLTLRELPEGRGAPLAWDNVLYGSRSLGYVVATHQHLRAVPRATVLTFYQPLDSQPPAEARRAALARPWTDWCESILAELSPAHPRLEETVERIDVRVWGHGMICPVPGWLWDGRREAWGRSQGRIHWAHSDLGGMSLFEEAYIQGVQAARAVRGQASGKGDA
jgi:hypothetical protein